MEPYSINQVENTISFIEDHLDRKLDLDTVAKAMHYSKYHLHRMFRQTTGITLYDYMLRRRLTEAAKELVFSKRPILEISLDCGFESQQAFTTSFKAMYKLPPAGFRRHQAFYPLQLKYALRQDLDEKRFTMADIRLAKVSDIPAWMESVRLVVDGYPCLVEADYLRSLKRHIAQNQALILREKDIAVGVMAFSCETGNIEFWGIHPQYRRSGMWKLFLEKLADEILPGQDISVTTYRSGDRADTGYRKVLKRLGFVEKELLTEFGYPAQRFVLPSKCRREHDNEKSRKQTGRGL